MPNQKMKKDEFIFLRNVPLEIKGDPTISFVPPADADGYVTMQITVKVKAQVATQDDTEILDAFLPGALFNFKGNKCAGIPPLTFRAANEGSNTDSSILFDTDSWSPLTSGIKVEHGASFVIRRKDH